MKPVTYSNIVFHEKKYLSDLEEKIEKLREIRKTANPDIKINLNKYKSKLIQKIKERDRLESLREQQK